MDILVLGSFAACVDREDSYVRSTAGGWPCPTSMQACDVDLVGQGEQCKTYHFPDLLWFDGPHLIQQLLVLMRDVSQVLTCTS